MGLVFFLIISAFSQEPYEYITGFEIQKPIVVSAEVPTCRDPYEKAISKKSKWSPLLVIVALDSGKKTKGLDTKLIPMQVNEAKAGKKIIKELEKLRIDLESAHHKRDTIGLKKLTNKIVSRYYKKTLKKKIPKDKNKEIRVVKSLLKAGYDGGRFCQTVKIKQTGELKVSVKTQAAIMRDVLKELIATMGPKIKQ